MIIKKSILLILGIVFLFSCKETNKKEIENNATVYFGGDILTMEGDTAQYAEALVINDGRIVFVGSSDEAMTVAGQGHKMIDLKGNTLMPSFIDPHSHFINSLGMSSQANCSPSPVGEADDVTGVIKALSNLKTEKNIPEGKLMMGYGYDDTVMPEGKLLNRDSLDEAFPNNPVMVFHVSLHGAVLNSKAMEYFGISSETKTPPGGIIVRKPGTNEPYGLIMETAFLPIFANLPKPTDQQLVQQLKDGQMIYASAGITTAQEGASHIGDVEIIQKGADNNALFIDVVSYPFITEFDTIFKIYKAEDFGKYNKHFKLGGIKITIDGSPQGRTALFTTPYLTGGPSGEENWLGESTFSQEEVNQMLKNIYDKGLQSTFHANGDGAIDMCIKAHEFAASDNLSQERRTTIIHSQFVRLDQLDKFVAYKMIPSLYTEHTFFFADAHIKNRGLEQASFISPMKTAIEKGLKPTNHTDFNVAPIDQMMVVWTAVNRVSRNGEIIGAEERVTAYQALQAITSNAAYQYFEEDIKGSLAKGKLADLVILDHNPLKVEPMEIRDITVLETIKEGKTIFKK
ncbi:amidohydrolase [Lutimonas halocynthiae]|uniref:amidohydrolase n=1 Tax=Lutimonas halocynthiae TaxID=1446477 RepID=UPI0025B605F6|nr:amidohydrolase [Lutimonas halocynthiae]MDN3641221.1 amidohydrolase [Lutimonas halocynthiae]